MIAAPPAGGEQNSAYFRSRGLFLSPDFPDKRWSVLIDFSSDPAEFGQAFGRIFFFFQPPDIDVADIVFTDQVEGGIEVGGLVDGIGIPLPLARFLPIVSPAGFVIYPTDQRGKPG